MIAFQGSLLPQCGGHLRPPPWGAGQGQGLLPGKEGQPLPLDWPCSETLAC